MSLIGDYIHQVYLAILSHPAVIRVEKRREEEDAMHGVGFFRYRITLSNGDFLELAERMEATQEEVVVVRYRHHWQDGTGKLIKRWDNAPHHPELSGFPYHLHDADEKNVVAHPAVSALGVLTIVFSYIKD